jgi:Fe-S-cluster containining protein
MVGQGDLANAGVALRVDAPEEETRPPVKVDCAARMHICHAICCQLDFALTQAEVESGQVKWDLGHPYYIRHEANGFCTHNNRATGGCGVYADRPAICRSYSCANDGRIWKDFEKMELNEEWLAENLSPSRPRALRVLMHNVEALLASCSTGHSEATRR